jgi:hypothetical protein
MAQLQRSSPLCTQLQRRQPSRHPGCALDPTRTLVGDSSSASEPWRARFLDSLTVTSFRFENLHMSDLECVEVIFCSR